MRRHQVRPLEGPADSILGHVCEERTGGLWRRKRVRKLQPMDATIADFSAELEDPGPGPEENTLRHEKRRLVWAALAALPASSREILVLRDFHDLTYDTI